MNLVKFVSCVLLLSSINVYAGTGTDPVTTSSTNSVVPTDTAPPPDTGNMEGGPMDLVIELQNGGTLPDIDGEDITVMAI